MSTLQEHPSGQVQALTLLSYSAHFQMLFIFNKAAHCEYAASRLLYSWFVRRIIIALVNFQLLVEKCTEI